jgi:hypothetical protein
VRIGRAFIAKQEDGGARRDRTDDLLLAKQALSQLSYGPAAAQLLRDMRYAACMRGPLMLVGLGRFELPTSPLSGVRSNQLSYRPGILTRTCTARGSAGARPAFEDR